MKSSEIRRRFLSFFEGQGHTIVPSAPLVPQNDPTLYFVNAGMVPFKDTFLGLEPRDYVRATTVQKCLRVSGKHNDLDNVGRTPRHHTFFEMLGNFSFGDYFKEDAIPFAWELLTGEFGLDPNRLWVTVYEDDDEAYDLWRSKVDFPEARLQRLGAKDNFWSMGPVGPCGPCTEIHYDHGPGVSSDERGPAGEDDRYVEIWNLVFMQYDQAEDGTQSDLPRPSIDTGMGLERLAAVKQGVYSNYDTDLFTGLIQRAAKEADVRYGADADTDTALRVLADHARATAFLVADGVMPANVERPYVLRRIMRRAIRFGVKIGLDDLFFHKLTEQVGRDFGEAYPVLLEREQFIREVVMAEEERFRRTLSRGTRLLDSHLDKLSAGSQLPGDVAFTLNDTYGFPVDLTELIAAERGVRVDMAGFEASLEAQKKRSRETWDGTGQKTVGEVWHGLAAEHGETTFTGYEHHEGSGEVLALFRKERATDADGKPTETLQRTEALTAGDAGILLLDNTPFYGESGGQAGDAGTIVLPGSEQVTVVDVTKASGLHLHHVKLDNGAVSVGDPVRTHVDARQRDATRRNHTATHLLHAALRNVLGTHVTQKGSLVEANRLRFDFSHHKPMTAEEVAQVESMVNEQVLRNTGLQTRVQSFDDARASGAMALFGEKYDDEVRVVDVPGFSVELCGGTHVSRTGDIGLFRITSEGGIAAGVRRIEAQTGHGALAWIRSRDAIVEGASSELKTDAARLVESIRKLKSDKRDLERSIESLEGKLAAAAAGDMASQAVEIDGVKVLATRFDGDLRKQADSLRDQLGTSVIVLATQKGAKAVLLAAATKDIAPSRVHAGKVIGEIAPLVGGRGGGRPDMAQAGGGDASGIDAALAKALEIVKAKLEG